MLKLKKSTNLNSAGEKVKKLRKTKNVLLPKSEVDENSSFDLKPKSMKAKKFSEELAISIKSNSTSEIGIVKSEKKIKTIPKPYRNSIEASTASSRNKIVKKYKAPTFENVKLKTSKKKVKSKDSHKGDGDKKPKLIDSEEKAIPKKSKSIDSEEKAIPKKSKSIDSEEKAIPKKSKSIDLEEKAIPKKSKSIDSAEKSNPKKTKSIDSEEKTNTKKHKTKTNNSVKRSKPKSKTKFGKKSHKKRVSKEGEMVPSLEEAPPFDQAHFNAIIKQDKIKRITQVLNKLVKNETSKMKNSIFGDYRYNLNIACFKIPSVPKRIVKLKVKHSLADDDTLLIVKDLQRGLKVDYEPTNQHYEDYLKENGVEGIKTVMSFNQLKTEYSTYEMKHKLSNLYDYYVCDGAIVGHVVGFLGKIFSTKSRCTPYAVRLSNPKLIKTEIKKALHKTCYKQGQKGNLITIPIGTDKMTPGQVADNVIHVIGQLKTIYPGGFANIRNMTLGINLKGTSSLPIYINMGKPIEATPYIVGPREDKLSKLKEQANKILSQFEFTNDASMVRLIKEENTAKRKRANGMDEDDDNENEPKEVDNKTQKKAKITENIMQKIKEAVLNEDDEEVEKNSNADENEDSNENDDSEESDAKNDDDSGEDEEGDSDDESN